MIPGMDTEHLESREEKVYRWTVRTLYVVALTLNAVLIYEQVKDSPEVTAVRARVDRWRARFADRVDEARRQRADEAWVVWEALTILEEAAHDADE